MSPTSYQTAPSRTEDLALYALKLHNANYLNKKLLFANQVLRIDTNTTENSFSQISIRFLNPQ
jgi:hypothetical protein